MIQGVNIQVEAVDEVTTVATASNVRLISVEDIDGKAGEVERGSL